MKTLEDLEELEQCSFGQPHPRHGLKLLYWFVNDCLDYNKSDILRLNCYPEKGDFGFHTFKNRYERNGDGDKLLPDEALPYYVLGNLSYIEASDLPIYVREDYTHSQDKSNMDRIIVSLKNRFFHRLYVTEHSDRTHFNKYSTYEISMHLILIIRDLTLEEFLLQAGYLKQETNTCLHPSSPAQLTHLIPPPDTTELRSILKKTIKQENCKASSKPSICQPAITSSQTKDILKQIKSQILMKNNPPGHHDAPPTPSIHSLVQDGCKNKDVHDDTLRRNSQQGHHDAPLTPSICRPTVTSTTTQDILNQIKSHPISTKNNPQGHHDAPPTPSIHSPEITSLMTKYMKMKIKLSNIRMKRNPPGHHDAPPTSSIHSPVIMSSTTQDIQRQIKSPLTLNPQGHHGTPASLSTCSPLIRSSMTRYTEKEIGSLPILMKNNTQPHHVASPSIYSPLITSSRTRNSSTLPESYSMHTTAAEGEPNLCVQDDTIRTSRDSNLQTPLDHTPPTPTCTPTIMSPFSQMSFSFCLVFLLFWVLFFTFIWGNLMRLFIISTFVALILPKQSWKRGELGESKEREETQKGKNFKSKTEM